METIELIDKDIKWLQDNAKSNNIVHISQILNHMAILSINVAHNVSEAYALMNTLEDEYDNEFSKMVTRLIKNKTSAAAAERHAESELVEMKKDYTDAKNIYKRLSMYLDRVDRTCDFFKQYISNLKIERTASAGGI